MILTKALLATIANNKLQVHKPQLRPELQSEEGPNVRGVGRQEHPEKLRNHQEEDQQRRPGHAELRREELLPEAGGSVQVKRLILFLNQTVCLDLFSSFM